MTVFLMIGDLINEQDAAETQQPASGQRKKAKTTETAANRTIENELNDLDLIAIGTSQGSILLYSLSKAALHSELVSKFLSFNALF